jgi:hypothetical protein
MGMTTENKSMWIGLVEVSPQEDAEVLLDVSGAFVNVVTWASNEAQFREKAKIVMDKLKLAIMDVEDAEPIANRGVLENEELLDIVARVENNPNAIIYGTFQTWSENPV